MKNSIGPVTGHTFGMGDRFCENNKLRAVPLLMAMHGNGIVNMPDGFYFFEWELAVFRIVIVLRMIGRIMQLEKGKQGHAGTGTTVFLIMPE